MKLSELKPGTKMYTQRGHQVLAVLTISLDGSSVYVGAVPGTNHDTEWMRVANDGDKQCEAIAIAIVKNLFHPGFEIDLDYVP